MSLGTVGADRRVVVTAHRRRRAAAVAAAAAARPDTPDAWACRDSGLVLLGDAAVGIERRVGEAPEVLFEREARQRRVRRASRKLGARRALPLRQPLRSVLHGRFLRCEQVAGAVALRRLLAREPVEAFGAPVATVVTGHRPRAVPAARLTELLLVAPLARREQRRRAWLEHRPRRAAALVAVGHGNLPIRAVNCHVDGGGHPLAAQEQH